MEDSKYKHPNETKAIIVSIALSVLIYVIAYALASLLTPIDLRREYIIPFIPFSTISYAIMFILMALTATIYKFAGQSKYHIVMYCIVGNFMSCIMGPVFPVVGLVIIMGNLVNIHYRITKSDDTSHN